MSFLKNTAITVFSQGVVFIAAFAASVVVARGLNPDGKGVYGIAVLFANTLTMLFVSGQQTATAYFLAKAETDRGKVIGTAFVWIIGLSILAVCAGFFVLKCLPGSFVTQVPERVWLLALLLAPVEIAAGILTNALLGLYKIWRYNLLLIIRPLLMVVFLWLSIFIFEYGIEGAVFAQIIAGVLVIVWSLIILRPELKSDPPGFSFGFFRESGLYGIKLLPANLLLFASKRAHLYIAAYFLLPFDFGLFTLALGITERIYLFADAVGTILFRDVSANAQDRFSSAEKTFLVWKVCTVFAIFVALALAVLSPWFIPLVFGSDFSPSVKPLCILLFSSIAASGWRLLESDLKGRGRPGAVSLITGVSMAVNLSLAIALIPLFGITGAAWSVVVSDAAAGVIGLMVFLSISPNLPRQLWMNKAERQRIASALQRITKFLSRRSTL